MTAPRRLPSWPDSPRFDDWPPEPPRRRRHGLWTVIALVGVFVVGMVGLGIAGLSKLGKSPAVDLGPPPFTVPPLSPAPRSAVPDSPGQAPTGAVVDAWIGRVSAATDIPTRVLRAYVYAESATRQRTPSCHITWATVAGIGRIESKHGFDGASAIALDGQETPPVVGVALDGSSGVQAVPDTDEGKLDGDPKWDHAVGPMQFVPATWKKWGVRAGDDGKPPDPQNIDDAALTSARYMCAKGGNLATSDGWWTAVLTYNNSTLYGQAVFSNAEAYGKANLATPPSTAISR